MSRPTLPKPPDWRAARIRLLVSYAMFAISGVLWWADASTDSPFAVLRMIGIITVVFGIVMNVKPYYWTVSYLGACLWHSMRRNIQGQYGPLSQHFERKRLEAEQMTDTHKPFNPPLVIATTLVVAVLATAALYFLSIIFQALMLPSFKWFIVAALIGSYVGVTLTVLVAAALSPGHR